MRRLEDAGKQTTKKKSEKKTLDNHLHSHPLPLLASYIVETFNFKPSNVCMCKGSAEERERSNTWWTWLDTQCGNDESTEKMKFKFHPRHHVVDDDKNGTRLELSSTSTDPAHRLSEAKLPPLLVLLSRLLYLFLQSTLFRRKSSSSSQNRVEAARKYQQQDERGERTRTKNILHLRRRPKTSCYLVEICKVFVKTFSSRFMTTFKHSLGRIEGTAKRPSFLLQIIFIRSLSLSLALFYFRVRRAEIMSSIYRSCSDRRLLLLQWFESHSTTSRRARKKNIFSTIFFSYFLWKQNWIKTLWRQSERELGGRIGRKKI